MRLKTVRQVKQQHQQQKRRNNRKMEILSCKFYSLILLLETLKQHLIWRSVPSELIEIPRQSSQAYNFFFALFLALHRNLLLLTFNDVPATKSLVQLSAPEAESVVEYFLATMYGGGQEIPYSMNGNMIESSMIPGSTGISPSPTMIQQQHASDLYSNGGPNMIASLRTHSSKFPVSWDILHMLIPMRKET